MGQPREGAISQSPHLLREAVLNGLRGYSAISAELSKQFGESLGLHSTDAAALIEILDAEEREAPLSPARLSQRIGLTSGATSSLLNRLEAAGHIVRSRIHADRRIVTLTSTEAIQGTADEFFHPLADRLNVVMSDYSAIELERFETFLRQMHSATESYMRDLTE